MNSYGHIIGVVFFAARVFGKGLAVNALFF
jgi:hypothetical protein